MEVLMKKEHFVSPLEDFAFKQIFGEQQRIDCTKQFLKTLLDIPEEDYKRLTVVNPNLGKIFRIGKTAIVDIKLTTKSGRIIHVELQVQKRANSKNRIIYYSDRQISDQLKWGEDYIKLKQVISVVICDHNLLEEEIEYMNEYELRNKHNRSFTKLKKLIILELPKLPETADGPLWPWLRFLKCKSEEELDMLAESYPEMEKPVSYIKSMTLSLISKWRDYHLHRNLARVDEKMLHLQWKLDGIAEGKAEGEAKARAEVLELLSQGLSVEDIKQHLSK